jgi:hypothetical protein
MQLAEQQGEALLHDVERVDAVADDPERDGVDAVAVAREQLLERGFEAVGAGVAAGGDEVGVRIAQEFHGFQTAPGAPGFPRRRDPGGVPELCACRSEGAKPAPYWPRSVGRIVRLDPPKNKPSS